MNVQRAKLPKGLSYPIQTGVIAAALQDAGVTLDCTVNYYNQLGTGFAAWFWPPNPDVQHERLYLTIGAVRAEEAAAHRQRMSETVLPEFIAWVRGLLSLPANSPIRCAQHEFHGRLFGSGPVSRRRPADTR